MDRANVAASLREANEGSSRIGDRKAFESLVRERDLIERINAGHQEVEKAVLDEFQPKLTASKGDDQTQERLRTEMRERKLADLRSKLDSLLSPNQKSAFDQAAAAEVEAAQKGKK